MSTRSLSIYLLKSAIRKPADAIRSDIELKKRLLKIGDQPEFYLYARPIQDREPSWASFFQPYVEPDFLGRSSSPSAALLVPCADRWFAVTFGYGRNLLASDSWDERFGLIVALNSIEEGQIRSIDKRTFDAFSLQTREQASRDAATSDFGLDVERDLLRAVTGTPSNQALGKRLSGMDALKTHIDTTIDTLHSLLNMYHDKFLETGYEEKFPWVNQLAEVKDSTLKQCLDDLLLDMLRSRNLDSCWLAPPELVDWGTIQGFKYRQSRREPTLYDVHVNSFSETVEEWGSISLETLKRRQILCIGDDDTARNRWSVYKCLYCEVQDKDESTYVLSEGKWYQVASDFLESVNRSYQQLPRYQESLPIYDDESEGLYNSRVADELPDQFALLDLVKIPMPGGHNSIEFCDLLSKKNDIIHVKRYRSSSSLSHLFAQGLVSAECFLADTDFRCRLNDRLPEPFRLSAPAARPEASSYQIVYAIISRSREEHLRVPFFSRLTLRHAARRLRGFGYRVAIAKIEVDEQRAMMKKYPSYGK